MLILSRRVEESITIGDDIEVIILGWHGNQCRVGIKAPKHIQVDRKEIRVRKDAGVPKP